MGSTTNTAGETLRRARLAAGLTLRELAQRAGTSHATLSAYEQCVKSPTMQTLLRVLEASGFSVDIKLRKRIREANGLKRGDELVQVLRLAGQFPVRTSRSLEAPRFSAIAEAGVHGPRRENPSNSQGA